MKAAFAVRPFLAVAVFVLASPLGAIAADAPAFEQYKNIVDLQFMKENAVVPVKDGVLVVDARPSRKYDEGHIPGAINIPDTRFDKMTDKLPQDKGSLLVFYCGGLKCPLSHKSAVKAEALGYTNIKVFAEGEPAWTKDGNLISVSAKYVKKALGKGAVVVDARPARKVKKTGIIPGAINIPDTKFDKMTDQLPAAKDAELIFYCGGVKCPLSPKSAAKAKALGYTNVKLYQAGYPDWTEVYGKGEMVADAGGKAVAKSAAPAATLKAGPDGDSVDVESFKKVVSQSPESIHIVDVRGPEEFEGGSFPNAINIPVDEIEDRVAELPDDKPIVFVCATGARSGEAYDIVKFEREDLKTYFLDAEVTYKGDGMVEIKATTM